MVCLVMTMPVSTITLKKLPGPPPYTGSIRPFKHTEDGRSAWFAIVSQFAGKDKWQAEIKRNEQLLHTRVWKGQSNFTLETIHDERGWNYCEGHTQDTVE